MPVPTSKRQFRFLQAVKSGKARKNTTLTPSEAKEGLKEFSQAGESFSKLREVAKRRKAQGK